MKKIDLENIKQIVLDISKGDSILYKDLPKYDLFLSQVTDYLNDKFTDEKFTKSIVQNYIKQEVISKPEDGKKRGYTKNHLIQLILTSFMRPTLSTEEIKRVFSLAFNDINDQNDDILCWEETYKVFVEIQRENLYDDLIPLLIHEDKLDEMIKKFNLKDKEEDRIKVFLLVLSLISEASAIKSLVQRIVKEYNGH